MTFALRFSRTLVPRIFLVVLAAIADTPLRSQTVISTNTTYNGATLSGNVTLSNGIVATFTNGTTFSGTTATLSNSSVLNWNQTGTLTSKAISSGTSAEINVGASNTLTLDSNSSLAGDVYLSGSAGSTIINKGSITQNSGTGYLYGPTVTNQGTINATAGSILYTYSYSYPSYTFTNAAGATVTATGSNAIVYFQNVVNQGTLIAQNNGVLEFQGSSITTANLGSVILSSGGQALLNGTLNNASSTLAAPSGGAFGLYGGTINNGTIAVGALTFTNYSGTLNNVTYNGDLTLPADTAVNFTGATNFTGTNLVLGSSSTLYWNEIGTLTGKSITSNPSGYSAYINVGANASLTLGSGTTVSGELSLTGTTGSTIVNSGSITQSSGSGTLYAPTFTNNGAITAAGGSSLIIGNSSSNGTTNASTGTITATGSGSIIYLQNILNQGTLNAQNNGELEFQGSNGTTAGLGTVVLATGGHALLNGTFDNTSATLTAPAGGLYELYGGTINNGTIAAGALTFTSGTLNKVSYTGDLTLPASSSVTFTGDTTTFTGSNLILGNYSTLNWNQNGTLVGKTITSGSGANYGVISVGTNNSLLLGSGTSLTGAVYLDGTTGATIINDGSITNSAGFGYIYAPTFTNGGSITANGGSRLNVGFYSNYSTTNGSAGSITATGTGTTVYLENIVNQGTLNAQNNGVLEFQGASNTTANLGSVVLASGGQALINGTLDNTSGPLTAPSGGAYGLYGGTINNGSIAAGALTFTNYGGTLNNVSYSGDLTLPASTTVTFTGTTNFTGANLNLGNYSTLYWNEIGSLSGKSITSGSSGSYAYISVGSNDSLTLSSGTSVSGDLYLTGSTGSTIVNSGSITQSSGSGTIYAPTFTNNGTITASGGSSLTVGYYYNSGNTTNASGGSITASGTGTTVYLENIVNQGILYAQNNGVLEFQGSSNTTANLGSVILSSGGQALLNGIFDNTSGPLTAPSGGSYGLYGGTINNGTIAAGALTFTNYGGTLNNVSYSGDLTLPASTTVTFTGTTNFTGANLTLGNYSTLNWNEIGSLSGKSITSGSSGSYAYISVGTSDSLTLSSGTSVNGDLYLTGSTGSTIVNSGSVTQSSGSGSIYAPTFTNNGTITASGGSNLTVGSYYYSTGSTNAVGGTITASGSGSVVYLESIVNLGTLSAQNSGVLEFQGPSNTTANLGSVILSSGGQALLAGTFDNTSGPLTAPSGGAYGLYGGTINNGTIAAGALTFTNYGGTLNNVVYNGDLTLPASASLTFTGGTTVAGANLTLGNYSSLNLNQNSTLAGKTVTAGTSGGYAEVYLGANDSLTLGSTTTVTGNVYASGSSGSSLVNQGFITQTSGSSYIYIPSFTNSGVLNVQGGTLYLNSNVTNGVGGTIEGSGTIFGGSVAIAGGTIAPGNSIGTLTFASGGFAVTNPATLSIELGGTSADKLVFQNPTGAINIGTGLLTLNLTLLSAPAANTTFDLLHISSGGSGLTGTFAGLSASGALLSSTYLGTSYLFSVDYLSNDITLVSVPEPSTYALLASGLILFAGLRRRHSRR